MAANVDVQAAVRSPEDVEVAAGLRDDGANVIGGPAFLRECDQDSDSSEDSHNMVNVSLESDHLDQDQKAAHEAPTLPLGGVAKENEEDDRGNVQMFLERMGLLFAPFLTEENPLPENPTRQERVAHGFRCPPHGHMGQALSFILLPILVWLTCLSVFGSPAAAPNGPIFLIVLLVVTALILGRLVTLLRLPPLLGMLVMGIVLKNIPGLEFHPVTWPRWSSTLRGMALVIILMRAGLGLDPDALKRLSGMVFRLAFTPCLAETFVVAVASNLLLGFPWLWGFLLGFVLSAVSPAVVVPCLLSLQERGYGVAKGIPTLVIAAASVDDVLAISGFTILLGIIFKPDADLVAIVFQGPIEALMGLAFGVFWGLVVIFLPSKDDNHFHLLRFVFLFGGALLALFGSQRIDFRGAGALSVLIMSFVAGVGWRRQGWTEDNVVATYLAKMWIVFQPILFGLIGTEIQINKLDGSTVGWGLLVLFIGLTVRIVVSFLSVMGGNLTFKERLFVALAWLPKATVQAAIGPIAFDNASLMKPPRQDYRDLGLQVLTIAVLVILITAPLGSIAIMQSAPKLLVKEDQPNAGPEVHARNDDSEKKD